MKIYRIAKLSIEQIARNERIKAEIMFKGSLKNNCHKISKTLKDTLMKYDYPSAIVCWGTFNVDKPVKKEDMGELNPLLYDNEEQLQDVLYRLEHYWVKVENLIVDITADQFNDLLSSSMPPVFIGNQNNSRYKEIQEMD